MMNREYLASQLYAAYCNAVGGVSHDNKPLPGWLEFRADETKRKQSDAWLAAADRAIQLMFD